MSCPSLPICPPPGQKLRRETALSGGLERSSRWITAPAGLDPPSPPSIRSSRHASLVPASGDSQRGGGVRHTPRGRPFQRRIGPSLAQSARSHFIKELRMHMKVRRLMLTAWCVLVAATATAQQTTGTIAGRVLDEQKAAVPGATIAAKNDSTGFSRNEVSDTEGIYRITGLPVGNYTVSIEMSGFQPQKRAVTVNVSETVTTDFDVRIAQVSENVTVSGVTPLVDTTSSAVGGVVDTRRVENLPLNGRQFANLAVTIPGVGLGFHSDPTKSTQFSPQINGGNGRNVNYQIDGGDNNDDTVGGLLQLFPLEAIQEFNFLTSRYKAEYGRSNGGVMNIVTKSGTNDARGSFFELFRDKAMNAKTETEKRGAIAKQDYRRNQFGGSFGGPVLR